MSDWQKLWQTIDRLQTLVESKASWKLLLGEEWELAESWMTLQPHCATMVPHPTIGGKYLRVVEHDHDYIVGVDDYGVTTAIERTELCAYRLDETLVGGRIVNLVGTGDCAHSMAEIPFTYRLGYHRPLAGFEFPVYLSLVARPYGRPTTVSELAMCEDRPFLLIVPSHRSLKDIDMAWLRRNHSVALPMDFAFGIDADGWIRLNRIGEDLIRHFNEMHVPNRDKELRSVASFPTPSGRSWSDVAIYLVDGETVTISVLGCRKTLTYMQLGLANSRNAKPTRHWRLLESYALNRGRITWSSAGASASVKKQTQLLSEKLQSFFRIDGRPIDFDKESMSYTTRFHIEAT